jgi:hypothetical protein
MVVLEKVSYHGLLVMKKEYLQVVWTVMGLISGSFLHATVNIYAALGGQALAIIIMMAAWSIFVFFLMRPSTSRPYGAIIREVDLLKQIAEAEQDLHSLEKTGQARQKGTSFAPTVQNCKIPQTICKNLKNPTMHASGASPGS